MQLIVNLLSCANKRIDKGPQDATALIVWISRSRTPAFCGKAFFDVTDLTPTQLINVIALCHKAIKHLLYVSNSELVYPREGERLRRCHVWNRVKRLVANPSEDKDAVVGVLIGYCLERLVGITLETRGSRLYLQVALINRNTHKLIIAAALHRIVNLLTWVTLYSTKLTGRAYVTWSTFERITKRQLPLISGIDAVVNSDHDARI